MNDTPRVSVRNLFVLAYADGFSQWLYKAPTVALDDMIVPGFFNDASDMLVRHDVLTLYGKDGVRLVYVVETGARVIVGGLS